MLSITSSQVSSITYHPDILIILFNVAAEQKNDAALGKNNIQESEELQDGETKVEKEDAVIEVNESPLKV